MHRGGKRRTQRRQMFCFRKYVYALRLILESSLIFKFVTDFSRDADVTAVCAIVKRHDLWPAHSIQYRGPPMVLLILDVLIRGGPIYNIFNKNALFHP